MAIVKTIEPSPCLLILTETETEISEGETAFDVLKRITRENNIHMEFVETPL